MGFNQAPALPYRNLGIVEDGDAASQAIEKDKYIIWKGQNYFAKTDILQGETFVVDTNLTAMPEGVINGIVDALNASLMGVPDWANAVEITPSMNDEGDTWTASTNCYVAVHVECVSSGALRWKINNIYTFGGYFALNEEHAYVIPVAAGDVITTQTASGSMPLQCYMVPFKQ